MELLYREMGINLLSPKWIYAIVVSVDEYNNGFEKKKMNQIMIFIFMF